MTNIVLLIDGVQKMPKSRKRVAQSGAKSVPVLTKHKIGGRESNQGVKQMSDKELTAALAKVRKRDRNKLERQLHWRGML